MTWHLFFLKLELFISAIVTVSWANDSIVTPTLLQSSVGCEQHASQPLLVPS